LVKSHYDNAVSEMQNAVQNIKGKEHKLEFKKKVVQNQKETLSDSQKKLILHVPEEKETKVLRDVSNENQEKILTEIHDLEKKYSNMYSKLENLNPNIDEDDTLLVRSDLNEMNNLMNEFEHKKLALHKQKFQAFIHKLLKKFHSKKKKLLHIIEDLKKNLDNVVALNKEYANKIEYLQTSYSKLLIEFEELQELKKSVDEELLKYQKNEIILRTEVEKLKAILNSFEKENHRLREKNDSLESEKAFLLDENKKFLAKLTKFEAENAIYKLELEKMKEFYTEKVNLLKHEIGELQKTNKTLVEENAEYKKDIIALKTENQELLQDREKMREEIRELAFLLKEKGHELNHLKMLLDEMERKPPRQVYTEVPVEKRIEVPVEKIVEKIREIPVEKIIEVPFEKIVDRPVYVENDEQIRRMENENQELYNESNYWKERCFQLEKRELKGLMEERNGLVERNIEGENFINDLKQKINMMSSNIQTMQVANQEKNSNIAQYIESLISQNQYLENLVIPR